MIDTTASVTANANKRDAWQLIQDFESVWEDSNPAHRGTVVRDQPKQPIREGLRWWQREKVAGITADLEAVVTHAQPPDTFSWQGEATYHLHLADLTITEGGRFSITEENQRVRLTHRVWAVFPPTTLGRFTERILGPILRSEHAANHHTRVELEYFAQRLEAPHPATNNNPEQ